MKLNRQPRTAMELVFKAVGQILLLATILALIPLLGSTQVAKPTDETEKTPVPRGKESVDVLATVVAMSRDPWESEGYPFEILLLKVDKLDETKIGPYIRADLNEISEFKGSEESRVYRRLLSSLREPRRWKVHLKPPTLPVHCWRVPPPPIPGDLMSSRNPVIVPVGSASGYPSVNSVPCYLVDQRDIQEVAAP